MALLMRRRVLPSHAGIRRPPTQRALPRDPPNSCQSRRSTASRISSSARCADCTSSLSALPVRCVPATTPKRSQVRRLLSVLDHLDLSSLSKRSAASFNTSGGQEGRYTVVATPSEGLHSHATAAHDGALPMRPAPPDVYLPVRAPENVEVTEGTPRVGESLSPDSSGRLGLGLSAGGLSERSREIRGLRDTGRNPPSRHVGRLTPQARAAASDGRYEGRVRSPGKLNGLNVGPMDTEPSPRCTSPREYMQRLRSQRNEQ